jgi:hypothetical protein
VTQSGVTVYTSNWDRHSITFLLGRVITFNPDGYLSYRDATIEELALRMKTVHKEVGNGTFMPNREIDQLTRALRNNKHPDN